MKWSYRIARVAGIDVRVHVTFLLLLAYFGFLAYSHAGAMAALANVVFILLLFVCVLLHEFGHAFAARVYGIQTPDITLLPIGGVARLARMPENPIQELVVAVAGPMVNVVIALALWLLLGMPSPFGDPFEITQPGTAVLAQLLEVNVMLILFNMIPAFPMDGGRVLRAILATKLDHARATNVAAKVGQGIAVLFAIVSITGIPGIVEPNLFLLLIAMFVFSGAQQEAQYAQMRTAAAGLRVGDAMLTRFHSLPEMMSVSDAMSLVLNDTQPIFPVVDDRLRVVGMVLRNELLEAGQNGRGAESVSALAKDIPAVSSQDTFEQALSLMQQSGSAILPVVNPGRQIIGLVSLNLLSERARHMRAA